MEFNGGDLEPLTRGEILRAIKWLKNHKAAGIDNISAELIKYGGQTLHERMIALLMDIWENETMPIDWEEGMLVILHKKGDRTICKNFRGICILPIGYKILVSIIYQRLKLYCENVIGDYQAGFRSSRATTDQIFVLRQALEKYWEFNKTSYHLFVDFKQAYDSVHWPSLWNILNFFHVPVKLINLTQMCYSNTRCRIKIGGECTDPFSIQGGLKQGCALSTLLFNLVLEWVMRHTPPTRSPILIGNATLDRLAYADDVDLCGEELPYIEDTYMEFKIVAERTGLEVSIPKTKIMEVARVPSIIGDQQFGGSTLEAVAAFKYLGSTVTSSNLIDEEIRIRIAAGSRCSWALDATFKSRMLSKPTKTQTYTTIIRPIVIYGCETWRLTKELERRLNVFERGILRRIWGPVWDEEEGEWRRCHNHELMTLSGVPQITNIIRSHRL